MGLSFKANIGFAVNDYSLKIAGLFKAACLLAACSGIQHETPQTDAADEQAALVEINSFSANNAVYSMSEGTANKLLRDVYEQLKPSAKEICRSVDENRVCAWVVSYSSLREYNAVALEGNAVVVFHGIITATDSNDELAFVLAHELGHHIADHIDETRKNRNIGMTVAGIAMAALSSGAGGCATSACLNSLQGASQASMQLGGDIGSRVFSVEQEKEADYLAAYMLKQAGFDLDKSRNMLVKIGTKSGELNSGFLKSHPAGPERLASYDKAIEIVRLDVDGFPGQSAPVNDRVSQDNVPESSGQTADSTGDFDSSKCRIYLPETNTCIH